MMNITNTFGPYLVQRIEKPRELPPAGTPDLVEFHSKPANKRHCCAVASLPNTSPLLTVPGT